MAVLVQAPHWVCTCAIKGPINYSASVRTPITWDVDGYQVNLRSTWRAPLSDKLSPALTGDKTRAKRRFWHPVHGLVYAQHGHELMG